MITQKLSPTHTLFPMILLTILAFLGFSFPGCEASQASSGPGKGIHITGKLTACNSDSVYIFTQTGNEFQKVASGKITVSGTEASFDMRAAVPEPGVYFLGTTPQAAGKILLFEEPEVVVTASCSNFPGTLQAVNSPLNKDYADLMRGATEHMNNIRSLMNNMQFLMQSNPAGMNQAQQEMNTAQNVRLQFLESYINKGGTIGKIAALLYLKPFGTDPSHFQKYPSEIHYIAAEFFTGIDLADPGFAYIPNLIDRSSEYAMTLTQNPVMPMDTINNYFMRALAMCPAKSPNRKPFLTGLLNGLQQTKSELYPNFGEMYLNEFPEKNSFSLMIEQNVKALRQFAMGSVPPEINLQTPDGKSLALSSMKGQVVMLDFWASWCRPCRAENPNVVKLYNKYHGKGFEVLGVSLDKDKDPWLQAIATDGLTWKHVSDLQGWQSSAARDYSVTSIPMTFLLDKEGKIIGKNLRGPALENKLKEIYGF